MYFKMYKLLLILCFTYSVSSLYLITTPKQLKRYVKNPIVVSLFGVASESNITVALKDPNGQSVHSITQSYEANNKDIIFEFEFGKDAPLGDYHGDITAVGGEKMAVSFVSTLSKTEYMIIFQTTSTIYMPSDLITFRAIVLDNKFVPMKDIYDSSIRIKDPKGSIRAILYQLKDKTEQSSIGPISYYNITNGITNDIYFQLDKDEMLGEWKIEMSIEDTTQKFIFQLSTNETPDSEINVEVPAYVSYADSIVNMVLEGKYYFGQSLKGYVDLNIDKLTHCGKDPNGTSPFIQTNIVLSDILNKKIDIKDIEGYDPRCDDDYRVVVSVRDGYMNETVKDTKVIRLVEQDIKVRFVNKNEKIKPGLKFRAIIEIKQLGNQSFNLESTMNDFKILTMLNDGVKYEPFSINKNKNLLVLDYTTSATTKKFNISIFHKDDFILAQSFIALDGCFKSLLTIDYQQPLQEIAIGDIVTLIITSNVNINMLKYYFVVDGQVNNASTIGFASAQTTQNMQIHIDRTLAPRSKLVVFYYDAATNSLAEDYLDIKVKDFFTSKMDISKIDNHDTNFSDFKIMSEQNSELLVHAYSSKSNLKEMNNLEVQIKNLISTKLTKYENDPPISNDIIFQTDVGVKCLNPYDLETFVVDDEEKPQLQIFSEDKRKTWIFDKYQTDFSDNFNISTRLPQSLTKFEIAAISLNSLNGINVARKQFELNSEKGLFATLSNLSNLKRNEDKVIKILFYNRLNTNQNININFIQENGTNIDFDQCQMSYELGANQIKTDSCTITPREFGYVNVNLLVTDIDSNETITMIKERVLIDYEGDKVTNIIQSSLEIYENTKNFSKEYEIPHLPDEIEGSQRLFLLTNFEKNNEVWYIDIGKNLNVPSFHFELSLDNETCFLKTWKSFSQISNVFYLSKAQLLDQATLNNYLEILKQQLSKVCMKTPYDGSLIAEGASNSKASSTPDLPSSTMMTLYYLLSIKDFVQLFDPSKVDQNLQVNSVYYTTSWLKRQTLVTGEILETDPQFLHNGNFQYYNIFLTTLSYLVYQSDSVVLSPSNQILTFFINSYPKLKRIGDKTASCLVFHLERHPLQDHCFEELIKTLKFDKKTEQRYIEEGGNVHLEATSFALMIMVKRQYFSIGYEIFKYLRSVIKENDISGNYLLPMKAMSQLVEKAMFYRNNENKINFFVNDQINFALDGKLAITQIHELDPKLDKIKLQANGFGKVNFYIAVKSNMLNSSSLNTDKITIDICKMAEENESNFRIQEIELPNGLKFDSLHDYPSTDNLEINGDGTQVNLFLNKSNENCFKIKVTKLDNYIIPYPSQIKLYPITI